MKNTYTLEIECGCPADNLPDVYTMTVVSRRTIPVEKILEVVAKYKERKIYQFAKPKAPTAKPLGCRVIAEGEARSKPRRPSLFRVGDEGETKSN